MISDLMVINRVITVTVMIDDIVGYEIE